MEDVRLGDRVRAVRVKQRKTQADVAALAAVRPIDVSHLEHGVLDGLTISMMRRIVAAIDMRIDLVPRWQGVDLDRVMVGAHDALQRAVLRYIASLPGWVAVAEATYSIFGERGAIDVLAWHEATCTVLIIELKTLLVDPAEIRRKNDERQRLAAKIAADRGWHAKSVAVWLVFADTRTNRLRVEESTDILKTPATLDGRAMRAWLRRPSGPVMALSFWAEPKAVTRRRVRPTKAELAARSAVAANAAAKTQRQAMGSTRNQGRPASQAEG